MSACTAPRKNPNRIKETWLKTVAGRNYLHHWSTWVREMEAANKSRDEGIAQYSKKVRK